MIESNKQAYADTSGFILTDGQSNPLSEKEKVEFNLDRIIEMAWEDITPFEAIEFQFGYKEADVKRLMKTHVKFSSYTLWRKRVESCHTKHLAKRVKGIDRFKSSLQRSISQNKISKR